MTARIKELEKKISDLAAAGGTGRPGTNGRDGQDGRPGRDGKDAPKITGASIDRGRLTLTLSDGSRINVAGQLPTEGGDRGLPGPQGPPGKVTLVIVDGTGKELQRASGVLSGSTVKLPIERFVTKE